MKNRTRFLLFIFIIILLNVAGCSQKVEQKIYSTLEEVVELEEKFKDQQQPLVELEKKEKTLYDKILSLGLNETDQIIKLSGEAIQLADKRQQHLDLERESIIAAQKEFLKVGNMIEEISDEELKKIGEKFYTLMNERYKIHADLYEQYSLGVKYDKELYAMLKDKNVSLEDLHEKIDVINKTYQQVYLLNDDFNEKTEKYNKEKLHFYKKAGLNIELNKENEE